MARIFVGRAGILEKEHSNYSVYRQSRIDYIGRKPQISLKYKAYQYAIPLDSRSCLDATTWNYLYPYNWNGRRRLNESSTGTHVLEILLHDRYVVQAQNTWIRVLRLGIPSIGKSHAASAWNTVLSHISKHAGVWNSVSQSDKSIHDRIRGKIGSSIEWQMHRQQRWMMNAYTAA